MREDGKIDYVEFPGGDLAATKAFYGAAFGWAFTDYGPDYAAFEGQGADGGFSADAAKRPRSPWSCSTPMISRRWKPRWRSPAGSSSGRSSPFPAAGGSTFATRPATKLAVWSGR